MTKRNAWTVAGVGALLAAVVVTRTPAQQEGITDAACCLPDGACLFINESQCANNFGVYHAGLTCQQVNCIALTPPTVVGITTSLVTGGHRIFRQWSDGQTDVTFVSYESNTDPAIACNIDAFCGPAVLIPGTCPTDVDRNGDTGITDFLTLLGGWGPCR